MRRKKFGRTLLALATACVLAVTAAGCGGGKGKDGKMTLHINIMNEFTNIDKVLEVYREKVKDDPLLGNVDLDFTYWSGGDYSQKLSMAMNAQEDYDLMFAGTWHGLQNYIADGSCADLTKYFNNDEYPGLKAAFPKEIIESNMTYEINENGEYEKHLYRVPILEAVNDTRGLYIREDLRKKYHCPEIVDDDTLQQFLDVIKEKEPKILPWSMYGLFFFESPYYSAPHDNIFPASVFSNEVPFYVYLSDDYKKVVDAVVMGDTQEHFDQMPEGYQYDFIKESHENRVKWAKYMDPARADVDATLYSDWAVMYGTVSGYAGIYNGAIEDEEFMKENPDFELSFYVTEEDQRNMEKGAVITEMSQGNNLIVPSWSKNIDTTMKFLDWMFASAENHDLFQYGIEGVDWEKDGDVYKQLTVPQAEQYTMPGYAFTWNPSYTLMNEVTAKNESVKKYFEYQNDLSTYVDSPLSGFVFDTDPVRTQVANVSAKAAEIENNIKFATMGEETGSEIDKWYQTAVDAGLNDIRAEYIKQLQAFLDYKFGQQS